MPVNHVTIRPATRTDAQSTGPGTLPDARPGAR